MNTKSGMLLAGAFAALAVVVMVLLRPWVDDAPPNRGATRTDERGDAGHGDAAMPELTSHANAEASGGFYRSPVGTELRFRLQVEQGMAVSLTSRAEPERSTFRLAGEFVLVVLERKTDEIVIEVSMPGMTAHQGAGSPMGGGALTADLGKPAFVRMRDDGSILGVEFATGVDHRVPNWLRSVLAATRFVVEPDQTTWTRTEEDATGSAETNYSWDQPLHDGRGIVRKHRRFLPASGGVSTASAAGDPLAGRSPEGEGTGKAVFDTALGWYTGVDYVEELHLQIPEAGYEVSTSFVLTMACESRGLRERVAAVGMRAWQSMDGRQAARVSSDIEAAERQRAEAATLSVPTLLQALDQAVQAGDADPFARLHAMQSLSLLLRERPEVLDEFRNLLLAGGLREITVDLALVAAAEAGTGPAQAMLADLLDHGAPGVLGRGAVRAVFALAEPSALIVDRVAALAHDGAAEAKAASLLALGCAAGRLSADRRAAAVAHLQATRPTGSDGLDVWLHALGNSGLPESIALSEPYRQSGDPARRAAALVALRRVPGEPALSLLGDAATGDPAAAVRRSAIAALDERSAAETAPILARVLERETDRDTLEAVIGQLQRCLPQPAAVELLTQVARGHAIPDVRQWASAALRNR